MLNKLKDDILRLLKEDEEFRYAVVGLLGLQRLEEAIARLIDAQTNMEARLSKVEEAIVRLTDSHIELRNVVASIKVDIKDLRSEMKKVSDKYGLTLEDLAVSKLPLRLQEEGIVVNKRDIRTRYSVVVRDKEREVDIYTEGKIDGKTVRIIGEVKSIIDKRDVKRFYDRFKEYDAIKCMLGHTIRPDAEDIAKKLNVKLYSVIG
jgi:archaellum component FlaC